MVIAAIRKAMQNKSGFFPAVSRYTRKKYELKRVRQRSGPYMRASCDSLNTVGWKKNKTSARTAAAGIKAKYLLQISQKAPNAPVMKNKEGIRRLTSLLPNRSPQNFRNRK